MINIIKKIAFIIYISIILFFSCGCWDYTELDKIALVTGFGIDLDENDEILITIPIMKPQTTTHQGLTSEEEQVVIVELKGHTVFEAISNASLQFSRKLYFAHNQVIVLGKEAAKSNPEGLLKTFIRDSESGVLDYVLVAENTASEILRAKGTLESLQSQDLGDIVENHKSSGKIVPIRLTDFSSALLSPTIAPVAPIVKLNDDKVTNLEGTAVFRDSHYVGALNEEETRGFLWITNKLTGGSITVEQESTNTLVSFEIINSNTRLKPRFKEDNTIVIEINIKATTSLANSMKSIEDITINEITELQKAAIEKKINLALSKARYYQADIFGFGELIHTEHPKQWKKYEQSWNALFPTVEYITNIKLNIKSDGLLIDRFKEK